MSDDETGVRFGPVWLAPGITRGNAYAFMLACFAVIGFLTFVNVGQAYVLNEILMIPRGDQGVITGNLAFFTEIVVITLIGGLGVWSDRIGRRPILGAGLLIIALSYVLYPLASSVTELTVYRMIYAVGVAAATGMLGTLSNDYPQEDSRGKLIAIGGIFNGLGVLIVNGVSGQVPAWLTDAGLDAATAGRYTHWIVAALIIPCALVLLRGLKEGTPVSKEERPPLRELALSVLQETRNPRIALSYCSAFVARGNMAVVGTFTILWGTLAALDANLDTATGARAGVLMFLTIQAAAMLSMPLMGILLDRINRTTGMVVGTGMGALGFSSAALVDNPLETSNLGWFVLMGIGQTGCFFASQTLVGQEAPLAKRGTIMGVFGFFGAVGILTGTAAGGWLFDNWMRAGPLIFLGAMNALIFLFALVVRWLSPGPASPHQLARRSGDAATL